MTEPRGTPRARPKTYHERKRAAENLWIEIGAWVVIGLGVLLVFA